RHFTGVVCAALACLGLLTPGANALGPAPVVTGLASACGPAGGGGQVVIEGTGLSATDTVAFGATPATGVTFFAPVTTPGRLRRPAALAVPVPAGTGTVDVRVTDPANGTSATSAADRYTYNSVTPSGFGICSVSTAFTDSTTGAPFTLAGGHPDATMSFS